MSQKNIISTCTRLYFSAHTNVFTYYYDSWIWEPLFQNKELICQNSDGPTLNSFFQDLTLQNFRHSRRQYWKKAWPLLILTHSTQYWYWNNIDIGTILILEKCWHWNNIDIGTILILEIYWYWNSFDIGIHIDIGTILILANILILEQYWYRNNIDIGTILILVGVACNDIGTEHNIKTLV